jgi:hypothetical protein
MAKPQPKAGKPGRNDPCPCGSGRKYKDCHRPLDEAARSEQLRLRQAQDSLMPKIIDAAQTMPERLPAAFERFWQGKYSLDDTAALDRAEDRGSERFLTWFAFDVRGDDGRTLVEELAASESFELDPFERRLIVSWTEVRLRPYVVDSVQKGSGVAVHDLLDGSTRTLADYGASKRLAPGEVIVGHLVPADTAPDAEQPTFYLAGAAAQLTDDTAAKLLEFAELHLADLRRSEPEASFADLIAQRSEILNHFVMALPVEHPDTSVMDRMLIDARAGLQLTAESVAALLGRPAPNVESAPPIAERASDDPERN